jgi:SAM-dependent methyltransferase
VEQQGTTASDVAADSAPREPIDALMQQQVRTDDIRAWGMAPPVTSGVMSQGVNDPAVVRREYESEDRFLARRLSTWAELDGPLVEDVTLAEIWQGDPSRVLEVGCGTGDFTARVRDALRGHLIAVDLSVRMAALTKARRIDALAADIQRLPFDDDVFEVVLANRVLYHVPDLDRGLREIARVLRPAGRLIVVTYSSTHLEEVGRLLERAMISSVFSKETGVTAMARYFATVDSREVSGTAEFRTHEALRGFAAQQFGDPYDRNTGGLDNVAVPFHATYRHSVIVGVLDA